MPWLAALSADSIGLTKRLSHTATATLGCQPLQGSDGRSDRKGWVLSPKWEYVYVYVPGKGLRRSSWANFGGGGLVGGRQTSNWWTAFTPLVFGRYCIRGGKFVKRIEWARGIHMLIIF